MPGSKKLFTEDTDVTPARSLQQITALLISSKARSITTEHENGVVSGVSFTMPYGGGQLPYRLPLRVEPVYIKINKRRARAGWKYEKQDREQAERIAWRQLYWWLKSQLALIELGMVEAAEVLMPYMIGQDGATFFDTYRQKLLAAPGKE